MPSSPVEKVRKRLGDRRIRKVKLDLVDKACKDHNVRSIADLGGCWGVDGLYLFRALDHGVGRAIEVDTHPTDGFLNQAARHREVELLRGNFGAKESAESVGEIDAVLFFDVLLHQVDPDWDQVLELYAPRARNLVVFNQQWVGGDKTIRLLELGREGYVKNVPFAEFHEQIFDHFDEIHPVHGRPWRDVHHIWQWGITDEDLEAKAEALGFSRTHFEDHGAFPGLDNFRNRAFIFSRVS